MDGTPGALVTLDYQFTNLGDGYVHPGSTATIALPPGTLYVGSELGAHSSLLSDTTPWSASQLTLSFDSTLSTPGPLLSFGTGGVKSNGISKGAFGGRLTIWIPCTQLPVTDTLDGFAVTFTGSTQADGGAAGSLYETTLKGNDLEDLACDGPGMLIGGGGSDVGVGGTAGFSMVWWGPGVSTRYDATLSVRIPPSSASVIWLNTSTGAWQPKADHGFQLYRCNLPQFDGELGGADFLANKDSCSAVAPQEQADFSATTHVVLHAKQWTIESDGVNVASGPVFLNVKLKADDCAQADSVLSTYAARADVRTEPAGAFSTLTTTKDYTVTAGADIKLGHWGGGNSNEPTASPGKQVSYTLAVGAGNTPMRNIVYTVDLPVGVLPVSVTHQSVAWLMAAQRPCSRWRSPKRLCASTSETP